MNMAFIKPNFERQLKNAVSTLRIPFELHQEQIKAMESIYHGKDTFVLMPTGSGKSLIYQILPLLFNYVDNPVVLVISPLNSIIYEQIKKLKKLGLPSCHLSFKVIYCLYFFILILVFWWSIGLFI